MSWCRSGARLALAWLGFSLAASAQANALDLLYPSPNSDFSSFELRAGGFAHSIGGREKGSADVNAELVLPRLPIILPPEVAFLVPRPHIGAMINTVGKTSYAYAGFVWQLNFTPKFFLEPIFGGVIHNGQLQATDATWNSLGCRYMFHTGLSAGYRVTERWTAYATWEHISNAGTCGRNVGQNDYGLRVGYTF